jgi:copper chaperone CopZ
MSSVTYEIPAISCGHCVHTIKSELSELEGVRRVEASLPSRQVTVEFEDPATEAQIKALLVEINYPPVM